MGELHLKESACMHARAQVFIISSRKIQERNYETLFKWITRSAGHPIGRIVLAVPPLWQASVVFFLFHIFVGLLIRPPAALLPCAAVLAGVPACSSCLAGSVPWLTLV
jgi:hypothetical protein